MKTVSAQEFRGRIEEAVSGISQVEVDPEVMSFGVDRREGQGCTYSIVTMEDLNEPISLHGEGLSSIGKELELNATTLNNLNVDEKALILNGRKSGLTPFVADVKGGMFIGKHDENHVSPIDVFDACLKGIDGCGEIVSGGNHVSPRSVSCDIVLPNHGIDPQNVGDLSHAAVKFQTNGKTQIDLMIYRLACTNGMVTGESGFREVMQQGDPVERMLRTTMATEECIEAAEMFMDYYAFLSETEVSDVHANIRQLCASRRIGVEVAEIVIDVWESNFKEMGKNLYSIMQAFTWVTTHGYGSDDNHDTLSSSQIARIDNMLTNMMVENASDMPHCNTCGAGLS